jgi:hypothetical protein
MDSASQIIHSQAIVTPIGCGRMKFHHYDQVLIIRFRHFVEAASFYASHSGIRS